MPSTIRGSDNFDSSIGKNIVQTHTTTPTSQSVTSMTRDNLAGLTASITPKSTNSKIMVEVRWCGEHSAYNYNCAFGVRRDGVDVGNPSSVGNRISGIHSISQGYHSHDADSTPDNVFYSYLDSPNTTNEVTYTASAIFEQAGTLYTNRTVADTNSSGFERLTSSITLTEVQG